MVTFALQVDTSVYTSIVSGDEAVHVNARLLLHRAYADVMKQKDWNTPDRLMEQVEVILPEPN